MRVEARVNENNFASVMVIIRMVSFRKKINPNPNKGLRFSSPIYSVIIPFNTPIGQTILHLRVERRKQLRKSMVSYSVESIHPYRKKPFFSVDTWKGSLKITSELPQLDNGHDKPISFVLQVAARTQDNEPTVLTTTQVSIVVVPEYAGNDYVQSSLAVVKNTSMAGNSSQRLMFRKSETSHGRKEFFLHRIFRRPSPEARRMSKADLRFIEIIRELKREVAHHLLG